MARPTRFTGTTKPYKSQIFYLAEGGVEMSDHREGNGKKVDEGAYSKVYRRQLCLKE